MKEQDNKNKIPKGGKNQKQPNEKQAGMDGGQNICPSVSRLLSPVSLF